MPYEKSVEIIATIHPTSHAVYSSHAIECIRNVKRKIAKEEPEVSVIDRLQPAPHYPIIKLNIRLVKREQIENIRKVLETIPNKSGYRLEKFNAYDNGKLIDEFVTTDIE